MLTIMIRYFFIIISFFYLHKTIFPIISTKRFLLNSIIAILTISLFSVCLINTNTFTRMTIIILVCYLSIISITKNRLIYCFYIVSIFLCISIIFYIFSCTVTTIIVWAYYKTFDAVPFLFASIISGLLQFLLLYIFLLSKRFRNGLRLLFRHRTIFCGSIVSTIFITCLVIVSVYKSYNISIQTLIIILAFLFAIILLYYWQHRITQTYLEKLRIANENSLENEISSLKEEITSLKADNHRLTQIVHKDNKLVPAMETTVLEFLQSAKVLSTEELFTRGSELSRTLQEMAKERKGILTSLSSTNNSMPSSGLIAIDGLLSYMEKRAAESNINYKVKMDDNIKELILTALNEDDLRHLLGDLIENAIIATNYSELPKHISIHLGSLQDKFLLEISDSGIPFNPETYQYIGYEHCSTHQEDGGTGTGLMDIWSIKKKYKASLYIYEYESSSNNIYTKKISFLFDGKNHFLLKTYRDKEIKNSLIRGDLHVFPHEAE